jgi:LmbE family N-acetylglucosaminyl deacetylase
MTKPLRLLCVTAHPDDEALGMGGTLARYSAEGVETYLLTATRGQRGWTGDARTYPGPHALGVIRERELRKAAAVLGLHHVAILDYMDGDLDAADPGEIIDQIAASIRTAKPDVIITFGPDGATGHPDHIAIAQFSAAAILRAVDPTARVADRPPHCVQKFYVLATTRERMDFYESLFGDVAMTVDGVKRSTPGWAAWAVTTHIDTQAYWTQVWAAVGCHRSQLPGFEQLEECGDDVHRELWGSQEFYRVWSLVNSGRGREDDLFAGLR